MKTIVDKTTNISKYLLEDDTTISLTAENITVGDPLQFTISDMNDSNSTVHESVATPPEDWVGNKYKYNGTKWTANADYVEPTEDDDGE